MLHDEARELLVAGYIKTHKAKEIAEAYSVSVPTVYRLVQQKRETGSVALQVNRRGRKRLLGDDDLDRIAQAIEAQSDITIRELIEKLQLHAGEETVRRAVIELGFCVKKKMIHASEQERPRCAGKTSAVERVRFEDSA